MPINQLVSRGFGNGTYSGTIAYSVTTGYTIGVAVVTVGYLFTQATIGYTRNLNSSIGYTRNIEGVIL